MVTCDMRQGVFGDEQTRGEVGKHSLWLTCWLAAHRLSSELLAIVATFP